MICEDVCFLIFLPKGELNDTAQVGKEWNSMHRDRELGLVNDGGKHQLRLL